ncbi:jg1925 [Pararge aegeria aegeria]|uniref:Jg1925 protein n=1 Tax=Pararge aegeria aegeria TaxID=348720 RepID=A0A8S4R9E8_9NEOP|nr:jg1925 [Pararge aegeria aegeria]
MNAIPFVVPRAANLGSSATLQEALGDLGGLLISGASSAGWSDPAGSRFSGHTYNGRSQTNQVRKRPRNRRRRRLSNTEIFFQIGPSS